MFGHVTVRVSDRAASERFYLTVLGAIGIDMACAAPDDQTVDAFHAAATGAGYRDNGTPGERRAYHRATPAPTC